MPVWYQSAGCIHVLPASGDFHIQNSTKPSDHLWLIFADWSHYFNGAFISGKIVLN